MTVEYDLVVIGSGPGGYVAAIRAAQLGLKTAIIEESKLGGVCLNRGCIPTKTLLHSAQIGRYLRSADKYGWQVGEYSHNLPDIVEHSRQVSSKLSTGVAYLLKKNNVTVFSGRGSIGKNGEVLIKSDTDSIIEANHVILATGASPKAIPGIETDGDRIITAYEALEPNAVPESMLIIGSGAIGIEFASLYNALGTAVTVAEIQDRILPAEDPEISSLLKESLENQGIEFLLETSVTSVRNTNYSVESSLSSKNTSSIEQRSFNQALCAVGVTANIEGLGLENTNIQVNNGNIVIDEWMRTTHQGFYAIGDVAGAPWLAHKASHEAITCVERIAGCTTAHPINYNHIPGCTYCFPQVASIGLTEEHAKSESKSIAIGRFPFSANGKALALGESEGLVKTVIDRKTGEILGVHMIGAEVTELISAIAVAMTLECTEEYLLRTVFPHPTLSEIIPESTLSALERAIHY